jgi:hypothetical protein
MSEPEVCPSCGTVIYTSQDTTSHNGRLVHVACTTRRQPMIGPPTCQ